MAGAESRFVSPRARERQKDEMGTLGSGNHYLEVQRIAEIFDQTVASVFGLRVDDVVFSIHCGSRGLGHQIGTEFLKEMVMAAAQHQIVLPDRELACAFGFAFRKPLFRRDACGYQLRIGQSPDYHPFNPTGCCHSISRYSS